LYLLLYNIFLSLYGFGARLVATWNKKAAQWVKGRADSRVPDKIKNHPHQTVWMHCASLGEFEQGRPLLEAIRQKYPTCKIVLTFFSPSGYEIRKNYAGADWVAYLPLDGPGNAKNFIADINPSLVLWVKYEYWYYFLRELQKRAVPVLLVSGIFRKEQPFFKWYGGFWKTILPAFQHLFVQNNNSVELLKQIDPALPVTITGDTRFDRVIEIAEKWEPLSELVRQFCEGHQVIVAGSTWEEDEEALIHFSKAYPHIRFIIAPHEVSAPRISDLQQEFKDGILFSSLVNRQAGTVIHSNVLIIDNIGMLARLYCYADIAYVGGGFNQSGIHNILEAAVFGKPVIFGPVYEKFAEARDLVAVGGAFSISNAIELEALLTKLLKDQTTLSGAGKISKEYVYGKKGATGQIMEYIYKNRLLTN
jgi:3-deoxy-D-manno-octulosonic-acid transferase